MDISEIILKTSVITQKITDTTTYYKNMYDEKVGELQERLDSETKKLKEMYKDDEDVMKQKLSELQKTIDKETEKVKTWMETQIQKMTNKLQEQITGITKKMQDKAAEAASASRTSTPSERGTSFQSFLQRRECTAFRTLSSVKSMLLTLL